MTFHSFPLSDVLRDALSVSSTESLEFEKLLLFEWEATAPWQVVELIVLLDRSKATKSSKQSLDS